MRVNWHLDDIDFYLGEGISVLPTEGKKPLLQRWMPYKHRLATKDEARQWKEQYPDCNLAIVTGSISRIVDIDVDDMSRFPDLVREVPEVEKTTTYNSRRGMHFWFRCDVPLNSCKKFLGIEGIELLGNGHLATAPHSIVEGVEYRFETSLAHILSFPKRLLDEAKARIAFRIPKYKGDRDCIRQILERDIAEGERNEVFWFIHHGLQIGGKNSGTYAKLIVEKKNKSLSNPLSQSELEGIFKSEKKYYPGCQYVRDKLSFISCENCIFLNKRLNMKKSLLQKYHNRIPGLNNTERGVFLLFETHFDREIPKPSALRKVSGTDLDTAKNALRGIDRKIPELGIRKKLPELFSD